MNVEKLFTSPYGVIFILIGNLLGALGSKTLDEFPSPCGVISILTHLQIIH